MATVSRTESSAARVQVTLLPACNSTEPACEARSMVPPAVQLAISMPMPDGTVKRKS